MRINRIVMVLLTLIIAICLSIMPLPNWANWFRPDWVTLIVCYWILVFPDSFNVGMAWFVGLLLDALYGTILGEHALAMALIGYLILRAQRLLRHYPPTQQALYIFFCSFIYNLVLFIIQWTLGQTISDGRFWIVPILGLLIWPLLFASLKKLQRKFRIV